MLVIVKHHVILDFTRQASQEETAVMRTQCSHSDCLFLQGWDNLHKDPPHSSLVLHWRWPRSLRRIQVWHVLETHHCAPSPALLSYKWASQGAAVHQPKFTLLWQQLVSFIQIQCNWLHPGGTPGSNILIKLICEILTMWVFRWLVIWCERSLCFHWRDTGGAGTCFSKTLQKIITVELSWVRAITNDSVCLSPHETQFFHHHFFLLLVMACQTIFFPQSSSFVSNLLRMIRTPHHLDRDQMWVWANETVRNAFAFNQVLFSSCTHGKYMYIDSVF